MSILFFDGFDRYTATKDFDRNYWSFQPQIPQEYEKYAFGGYSYDHTQDAYGQYYSYYSPNNATLPTGQYHADIIETDYGYTVYKINSNSYPGFGSPYGFLALHNLDITDTYNLAPITYVQLSGFEQPNTDDSFLSARFLGIETKDTTYASSDKPGRFGSKHPLVAFCSGNTTGLVINVVKATGNHLSLIENQKMTIGLEIEQNGGSSGVFDLNLSEDIQDYQIRSVYSDISGSYSPAGGMEGRILTIARNDTEKQYVADLGLYWQPDQAYYWWEHADHTVDSTAESICPNSRWAHFGIGILHSGSDTYIQIKVENIDVLVIPTDDTITNKDLWEDKIYISGFNYDNIRFFNRTYNGDIDFRNYVFVDDNYPFVTRGNSLIDSQYYQRGSLTLIDDVVLSDASGTPNYFPGANTKVIPFTPGLNGNITNNGVSEDGLTQWSTNSSSYRLAVKNLDGDSGKIYHATSGDIAAVKHSNTNIIIPDSNSAWRGQLEDAVGGIKLYSAAKKEFLDTSYINVVYTGASDIYGEYVSLLLNTDDDGNIYDRSRNYSTISNDRLNPDNINTTGNINKFLDSNSIEFDNSYVGITNYPSLNRGNIPYTIQYTNPILSNNNPHPGYFFTIESWIYFTGDEPTYLAKRDNLLQDNVYLSKSYDIFATREYIQYSTYVETELVSYRRLYFPETIPTGEWHHIALNNDAVAEIVPSRQAYDYLASKSGDLYDHQHRLIAYLDGIASTGYEIYQTVHSGSLAFEYPVGNEYFYALTTARYSYLDDEYSQYYNSLQVGKSAYTYENNTIGNTDIDIASDGKVSTIENITSNYSTLTGSGITSSPVTGLLSGFNGSSTTELTLLEFDCAYSGVLHLEIGGNNYIRYEYNMTMSITKNNNPMVISLADVPYYRYYDVQGLQTHFHPNPRRIEATGNYPVASGDTIKIVLERQPDQSNAEFYIKSLYICEDKVVGGTYNFPTSMALRNPRQSNTSVYSSVPYGNIGCFVAGYLNYGDDITPLSWTNNLNEYPLLIGGNNILSNYRITQGTIDIGPLTVNRYSSEFATPTEPFNVQYDDYIPLGNAVNLTRTRYGSVNQQYFMENPVTNQPWNTGVIGNPSGFLLGVKKL